METPNELPFQTYQRIFGRDWPGGRSDEIVSLLRKYNITDEPGSALANLELQRFIWADRHMLSRH